MLLNLLWLLLGLALILWGADRMVGAASSVARRFNVSELVIGLTIVSLGTSMPEFVITLLSSIKGSSGLAIGNVVGSNLFNSLMIVGVSAIILPIHVTRGMITKEIPFSLLASVVLFVMACDHYFAPGNAELLTRGDGIILLCFFAIFMRYVFATAHNQPPQGEAEAQPGASAADAPPAMGMGRAVLLIVLGLAALVGGGELFVNGAVGVARSWGVSESVIGLTIVSAGTSLPELATSVVAAVKKSAGIAVGNVIGSNILNIFLILGTASAIRPMPLGSIGYADFGMLLFSGLLLWALAHFFGTRVINRAEGALMVLCYVGYIVYLILKP